MENYTTTNNNYCFQFVQPYMELLGQLTLIAWNTPHLLTEEQALPSLSVFNPNRSLDCYALMTDLGLIPDISQKVPLISPFILP